MTPGEALHTSARRHCEDRFELWSRQYAVMASEGRDRHGTEYTTAALRIFPRYNIARAIRIAIERLEPSAFADVEVARAAVAEAARSANDEFTSSSIGPVDAEAMSEERQDFLLFLTSIAHADLRQVRPLPYRRVLSETESERVWAAVRSAWDIATDYWYPLSDSARADVEAYDATAFATNVPTEVLRDAIRRQGLGRVWELKEYGPEFEEAVELFDPTYDGAEGYWCSERLDWIVYVSHEGSITAGGTIIETVHQVWPQCADHLWKPWTA